ncbi:MAG: hypothetical protein K5656_02590 [Lachnospiraceae bacterium]|nr:hypothetical protein [Lachnospiraceae bacterium]
MCEKAGLNQEFYNDYTNRLSKYKDIQDELLEYMNTGNLSCKVEISGYTAADILVWQIDHFKSHLDRGEYDYESNQSYMVLMAYDTLMKMKEDPNPVIQAFSNETGTDYAEKY